jgi:hypothetical protein
LPRRTGREGIDADGAMGDREGGEGATATGGGGDRRGGMSTRRGGGHFVVGGVASAVDTMVRMTVAAGDTNKQQPTP